eukprot:UC4_evm3s1370
MYSILLLMANSATSSPGPCNILEKSGNPCIAAHSTVRALYSEYTGGLYVLKHLSDNTSLTVNALVSGFADIATHDNFCKEEDCVISSIIDQSQHGNHLVQRISDGVVHKMVNGVRDGNQAYGMWFDPGHGYHNDFTTAIPKGNTPESIFAVMSGKRFNGKCCFDYGNSENTTAQPVKTGDYACGASDGTGPWIGADLESGMYYGGGNQTKINPLNTPLTTDFVSLHLKGKTDGFALKGGDAARGLFKTMYDGVRPDFRSAPNACHYHGVAGKYQPAQTINAMKSAMANMIERWDPETSRYSVFHVNNAEGATLKNDDSEAAALARDKHFFDSADGVGFFLNPGAICEKTGAVRKDIPKAHLLNKVGHALHINDDVFKDYAQSHKVAVLMKKLGYTNPAIPQSMYIFKQPEIGEQVASHQDSTFLNTAPDATCVGLLLFLEDATLQNGCLWARKGSHREPLRKRFDRNPVWFEAVESGNSTAGLDAMEFVTLDETTKSPAQELMDNGYLGNESTAENIENLRNAGYTDLPVKSGDLLLVHGLVDHLSLMNNSKSSRHTFQLHLVEDSPRSIWSKSNWQQYSPFPKLNKEVFK